MLRIYNARNNISFSLSEIFCIHLMASIGFINDQNTMRRVILIGYIHTLKIKIHIEDSTWNVNNFKR